jgi:hypothetical protein
MTLSSDQHQTEDPEMNESEVSREVVEEQLLEGIQSGPAREMTRLNWVQLKQRVWERNNYSS